MTNPAPRAYLHAVATAAPAHILTQDAVATHAAAVFAPRMADFERLAGLFRNTGIAERRAARPLPWYLEPHGWPDRNEAYLEAASELFVEAGRNALAMASLAPSDVDAVVTVSSTGIATPSLEARAAQRLGLRQDVSRVPVFGLGCAGGVSGLSIASRLAEARPESNVLLVVVELCTLSVRLDKADKANLVAVALFGDGAAACIVSTRRGPAMVEGAAEHSWPETLDIMGWAVDSEGLGVIFDRAIPPFAEAHLAAAVDRALAGMGLARSDVARFVCHPGGTKVVSAIETALALEPGSLEEERLILSRFGNMSAPTVLFVLERVLTRGLEGRAVLAALGPGFTLSCASLLPCR
jgi:alkylresorcinol/alkylpyrone synthase